MHQPTPTLRLAITRIFRYLQYTLHFGLKYAFSNTTTVSIYSDADWAGDRPSRRSTSGCCTFVNGHLISWYSKKQATVALSTMEAEYVAASIAVQECKWIKQLLNELQVQQSSGAPILYCDNQSALFSMENQQVSSRTKHIDIRYHFIKDAVENKEILVKYCPTE